MRTQRNPFAFVLVGTMLVFASAGCGGGATGGNPSGGAGGGNPGTPAGSQAVTVSFTINGVTQTLPLTVTVE